MNDNSIPTSVFTRTSNGPLPDVTSSDSNLSIPRAQGPSSPPQNTPAPSLDRSSVSSPRENRMTLMEEGRIDKTSYGERKIEEILSCLEGTLEPSAEGNRYEVDDEDKVVDLWHLRHLALSRGGLMSPKLRKRAWPKLVGVDEHILTNTSATLPSTFLNPSNSSGVSLSGFEEESESTVGLSGEEIKNVKEDICRGVWLVEYHIKMLKQKRENKSTDRSTPGTNGNDTLSPLASRQRRDPTNFLDVQSRSDDTVASELERPDQRSNRERGLILNIITGVLRSVPEGEDNSRLHYFKGLDDIAAIFLINLGSPSLASLVMKPLCHLHFRDAMRPNFSVVQSILQAVIMPLLEVVDRRLHDYIIKGGTDDSSVFALSWINTWFAHEIFDFEILSRLYDVFLVSHPLFPAYLAVGLLTYPPNRKLIMDTYCEFSALYRIICELPKQMGVNKNESEIVDAFEDCIQLSLCYIRDNPPSKLITSARKYRGGYMKEFLSPAPAVFLLGPPPRWAIASTAPTDWSLIKLAKKMRDQSSESRLARRRCLRLKHFIEEIDLTTDEHKIALVAFGLELNQRSNSRFRISKAGGLVGVALLIGALYGHEYYRGPTPLSKVLPSASLMKEIGHALKNSTQRSLKPDPKPKPVMTDEVVSSGASPHTDSDTKDTQLPHSSGDSSDQKQIDEDENTPQSAVSPVQKDPTVGKEEDEELMQSNTTAVDESSIKPHTDNKEKSPNIDILQGNEDGAPLDDQPNFENNEHLIEEHSPDHLTSTTEAVEKVEQELARIEAEIKHQITEFKENKEEPPVHEDAKEADVILNSKYGIPLSHESSDNDIGIKGKKDTKDGNAAIVAQLQEELDHTAKEIEDIKAADKIVDNISSYLEHYLDEIMPTSERSSSHSDRAGTNQKDSNKDDDNIENVIVRPSQEDIDAGYSNIVPNELPPPIIKPDPIEGPNIVPFHNHRKGVLQTIRSGLVYWISNEKLIYF